MARPHPKAWIDIFQQWTAQQAAKAAVPEPPAPLQPAAATPPAAPALARRPAVGQHRRPLALLAVGVLGIAGTIAVVHGAVVDFGAFEGY